MARDDEGGLSKGFYWGLGVIAAAAAGYLVWKYVVSEDTKNKARDMVQDTTTHAKRAIRDARVQHLDH